MKDDFSRRDVAALLEDLRGEFRTVSEVVLPLREDMAGVKERLMSLENRMVSLEDVVRLSIPELSKRVTRIESKLRF